MRLLCFLLSLPFCTWAQFSPPAGQAGSSAIHIDSANWLGWATACSVELGWQNCNDTSLGRASSGSAAAALGPAAEGATLSLGDGGMATLEFAHPIQDGTGPDFAVFENAFSDSFLELAFVEVSSDGQHFVRFPAISNTDTSTQVGTFGALDATKIYNLAGKYRASYATPFDLAELTDSSGLDLQAITHVRIIDVVGSLNPAYASYDSRGIPVNDPWPTPFPSSGFDLDGVGVLHFNYQAGLVSSKEELFKVYPNPAQDHITIDVSSIQNPQQLLVYSSDGRLYFNTSINQKTILDTKDWPRGLYILNLGAWSAKVLLH